MLRNYDVDVACSCLPCAGGFIGLVVGLSLLIIGSCVGVWMLLKRRNQMGRRPIPFFNRLLGGRGKDTGGSFGRLSSTDKDNRRGWVRTNDEDEDDHVLGNVGRRNRNAGANAGASASAVNLTPRGEREGLYSNDSNPFATPSVTRLQEQDQAGPYGDAFSTRPSTDSLDEAVHGPRYGGVALHDDPAVEVASQDSRSPPLSPSFERGTKFKEGF